MRPIPSEVQSVYARDPGIRMRGLEVWRVRLNRHLAKVDRIAGHAHTHCQILVYLRGEGFQKIAEQTHEIRRGALFFIPPRVRHSCVDADAHKPWCLALDFDLSDSQERTALARRLNLLELKRVRQELALLARWRTGLESVEPREAGAVLRVIDIFFRALGFLATEKPPQGDRIFRAAQRVMRDPAAFGVPLTELARWIGYQPDYLNRRLRETCGLTLGEMRDAARLRVAQKLLKGHALVAEVAAGVGFGDPNYFARWFRLQTGYTPSAWRDRGSHNH